MSKTLAELPLDERMPLALTGSFTAAQVAAVRGEAEERLADITAEADAEDVASLSPLATGEQAAERRKRAGELRWQAERLEASVAALSARAADLRDAERHAAADAARAEIIAERDALAVDIARDYPRIVRDLAHLVRRIEASDARCKAGGVALGAECIARQTVTQGLSGVGHRWPNNGGTMLPLSAIKIQLPMADRFAWEFNSAGCVFPALDLLPRDFAGATKP